MTIAELLVQATATITAGMQDEDKWDSPEAERLAVQIVTRIYGPPCESFGGVSVDVSFGFISLPAQRCVRCGWPRSMHKEEA